LELPAILMLSALIGSSGAIMIFTMGYANRQAVTPALSYPWLRPGTCAEYQLVRDDLSTPLQTRLLFLNNTGLTYEGSRISWCVVRLAGNRAELTYKLEFYNASYIYRELRASKYLGSIKLEEKLSVNLLDLSVEDEVGTKLGRWLYWFRPEELKVGNLITLVNNYIIWRGPDSMEPFLKPFNVIAQPPLPPVGEFRWNVVGRVKGQYAELTSGLSVRGFNFTAYTISTSDITVIQSEPLGHAGNEARFFVFFTAYVDAEKGLLISMHDILGFVDDIWVNKIGVKDSLSPRLVLVNLSIPPG
jgi:hypothetical protein